MNVILNNFQLRLSALIPSPLIWKCIAQTVSELKKAPNIPNVQDLIRLNKTIIPWARVGYEIIGYSQLGATCLIAYLPSPEIIVKHLLNICT